MAKTMFAVRVRITEIAVRYIEAESREELDKYLSGEEADADEVDFDSRFDDEEVIGVSVVNR